MCSNLVCTLPQRLLIGLLPFSGHGGGGCPGGGAGGAALSGREGDEPQIRARSGRLYSLQTKRRPRARLEAAAKCGDAAKQNTL